MYKKVDRKSKINNKAIRIKFPYGKEVQGIPDIIVVRDGAKVIQRKGGTKAIRVDE